MGHWDSELVIDIFSEDEPEQIWPCKMIAWLSDLRVFCQLNCIQIRHTSADQRAARNASSSSHSDNATVQWFLYMEHTGIT